MGSKWAIYNDFILENKDRSKSDIARMIYTEFGLDPSTFQALRNYIKRFLNRTDNSAIEQYCEANGIPVSKVDGYWHKGEYNGVNMSVRISEDSESPLTTEDIQDTVREILSDYKPLEVRSNDIAFESALKVVLSDIHVGLDPNPNGKSLFSYEYNADIFNKNLNSVYDSIIQEYRENGTFELFVLENESSEELSFVRRRMIIIVSKNKITKTRPRIKYFFLFNSLLAELPSIISLYSCSS